MIRTAAFVVWAMRKNNFQLSIFNFQFKKVCESLKKTEPKQGKTHFFQTFCKISLILFGRFQTFVYFCSRKIKQNEVKP